MAVECYEYIISGSISQQFCQNIFHFNVDNTAATDPFTMATAILTKTNTSANLLEKWCDCLPGDYIISSVRCRRLLPTGGPTAILLHAALSTSGGGRSGASSTSSVAPLMIWLTTLRPAKTGRTYFPGCSVDDLEGNTLASGLVTALTAFGIIMRDGFTPASPAYLCNAAVVRRAISAADDITAYRVSPIIGTQRRRQRPI